MKLYKDGKSCDCSKDQAAAMEAAGWSRTEQVSEETKDPAPKDPAQNEDSNDGGTPKSASKGK